jgi:hypothetical protein
MCSSVNCFDVLPLSSVLRGRLISESNTMCLCVYNLIVFLMCPLTPSNCHHYLEELLFYSSMFVQLQLDHKCGPLLQLAHQGGPCLSFSWKSSLWWSIYYGLFVGGFYRLVVYVCILYIFCWYLQSLCNFLGVKYHVYGLHVCAIYISLISVHISYVNSTTIYKFHHLSINYVLPVYCACFFAIAGLVWFIFSEPSPIHYMYHSKYF